MNKANFIYRPGMTLVEARMGRFMREGNNHAASGPGIQLQNPDNAAAAAGNTTTDSGVAASESNNAGETFDASSFWDGPPVVPGAASSDESAGSGTQSGGTGDQNGGFAAQLTSQLQAMTFGDPVFTSDIAQEINEGNYEGFEKRIQAQMQQAVRQSLAMNVQVLRPFAEQMMERMREEFGGTLNQRDNQEALIRDFPAAKDPRVAPVINNVFEQALKNNSGNRVKAVAQTKQMIALLTNTAADDLDLSVAPRGAGDSRPSQPSINWLDELTSR